MRCYVHVLRCGVLFHDVLRLEIFHGCLKVVAHEEKLVLVVLLGIMERGFERRHGEDQPTVASINTGKLEYIAEKSPVGSWVLGVDNNMRSIDQSSTPVLVSRAMPVT